MYRIVWVALMLFAGGCATVPRMAGAPAETTMEGLCGKYAADCSWDGVAQTVTMRYRGQKIRALVGSSVVFVAGTKLVLSAPLKRSRGAVIVPPDFEKAVFPSEPPIVRVKPLAGSWAGKVIVDAGHGGKDPGAIGFGGVKEKEIALDIAMRLARSLRNAGVEVIQTRDSDEFISLARRTEISSAPNVDLFISIHANATKSRRARGVEVYSAGPLSMDDKADVQRYQNVKQLCSKINMRPDGDLRDIVADMLYAYKLADTLPLAEAVSRELASVAGGSSRGNKTARFFVLRNTLIPAVLVEVGFISNPREALELKDGAYRQRIADAVAKGVMRCMDASGN